MRDNTLPVNADMSPAAPKVIIDLSAIWNYRHRMPIALPQSAGIILAKRGSGCVKCPVTLSPVIASDCSVSML